MSARQQIEDTAARWIIRREDRDWDPASQSELDAWLAESMAHKAAFWRLEHGWQAADRVAAVAPSPPPRRPLAAWRSVVTRHRAAALVPVALAASLALTIGVRQWSAGPDPATVGAFSTVVGRTATIRTSDGSRIEMNTATRLRTKVVADARDAWLDRGEAFFDIRHDPSRPFRVHAGAKTITVLGTQFSVRRDGDKVTVAVVSGRVRISDAHPPAASARAFTVAAGDVAVSAGNATLLADDVTARVGALTAWREGMVVFDQTPLSAAIDDLNRYTSTPIVIDDPSVGRFRISGTFRLDNGTGFLRLLQAAYGLHVQQRENAVHLSRD